MGLAVLFVAFSAEGQQKWVVLLLYGSGLACMTLGLIAGAGSQVLQRQADGEGGYRGPSPFLLFAASISISFLLAIIFAAVGLGGTALTGPPGALVSVVITGGSFLLLIQLLVVGTGALSWAEMGFARVAVDGVGPRPEGTTRGDLALGLALALPVLIATALLAGLLAQLLGVEPISAIPDPTTNVEIALNLITAAVIAPFTEEVFFRGFATSAWARAIGPGRAIARGALFFALAHVLLIGGASFDAAIRTAALAFVARLPVAYALEVVFVRRGSIWAPIALHAGFNGLALLIAYGFGPGPAP